MNGIGAKAATPERKEVRKKRYPGGIRLMPPEDKYALWIPLKNTKKFLGFVITAPLNCRDLKVGYSNKPIGDEDLTTYGRECRTESGEIVEYDLIGFGVYDKEQTYRLETPLKGKTLLLKRSNQGDLTVCLEGTDLSKAVISKDESRPYVGIHRIDGKTVGYTVDEFLDRVNAAFGLARFEIQLD